VWFDWSGSGTLAAPGLIVSMSFQLVILGGLLSSRVRFRFANQKSFCAKVVLPVDSFASNG
jgi:hypothetical protein